MRALASLKLTLVALVVLATGISWTYLSRAQAGLAVALPLLILGVNLAAAICVNAAFRRQAPLLVFHVALLALVVLVAAGRLTYLNGRVELSTGEAFAGELLDSERGLLHVSRLGRVEFVNQGFEIDYAPKWKRMETRNRVRWRGADGAEHAGIIGDQTPLVLEGYRFYTTSNKGFAPVFVWQSAGGAAQRGSVHLPPYPVLQFGQQVDWTLPGTPQTVTVKLSVDEELIDYERASGFRLPPKHTIEIAAGQALHRLEPGAALDIAGGRLRYERLGTWMGYAVVSDWTLPWVLAAAALAAVALGWHFWRRAFSRPWQEYADA